MKNIIYTIVILLSSSTYLFSQMNAILDIESNNSAFQLPVLSQSERLAMDMTQFSDEDGLLLFDSSNNYIYYYNGYINDWIQIGDTSAESPKGPPGPVGRAGMGQQGPIGFDGINCWDTNMDRFIQMSEDINGNGLLNAYDCVHPARIEGDQGPKGMDGPAGPAGVNKGMIGDAGVSYTITTHSFLFESNSSQLFAQSDPLERLFVQPVGDALPVSVLLSSGFWFLASEDAVTEIPAGSEYKIIRVVAQ